jgi:hypothetical protein
MGILLIKVVWKSIRCVGGEVLEFATYYQFSFKSILKKNLLDRNHSVIKLVISVYFV